MAAGVGLLCFLASGSVWAQEVTLHIQGRDVYAGLPFVLAVSATGFEPEPEPEISELEIAGAEVTYLGVSPNVTSTISISGGRRVESRRVEYVYRYRIEASRAGTYAVPAITVTQGQTQAASPPRRFQATEVPVTDEMQIALGLPERPVWVGESFDLTVDWLLRREPSDMNFSIPLLDDPSLFDVHEPDDSGGRRRGQQGLPVIVGDRELNVPFTQEAVTEGGQSFTRVRMSLPVTPIKAGRFEVPPTQVLAQLKTGTARDRFGFRIPQTKLFRASDVARTLEVRPLPLSGKPASFAGAVGTAFSIKVQASRTVVRVGEPIVLDILIRGDGRMEGLSLPGLINEQGLAADRFAVADDAIAGVVGEDGSSKRFEVTVRLESADVREIPRLGFSYFDPKRGVYETVYSEPIALQVAGSSVVGAGDVVSAVNQRRAGAADAAAPGASAASDTGGAGIRSFVGAELGLSNAATTTATVWTRAAVRPVLIALYVVPLVIFGLLLWQRRTRARRDLSSELRQARRQLEEALSKAGTAPARDAAPALLSALRALARVTGQRDQSDVTARIETVAYSPAAASEPLDEALRADVQALMESWLKQARAQRGGAAGADIRPIALSLLCALTFVSAWLFAAGAAHAVAQGPEQTDTQRRDGPEPGAERPVTEDVMDEPADVQTEAKTDAQVGAASFEQARAIYNQALAEQDRAARTRGFARAERMYRELVASHPNRPALLTDWGNAALGAQDLGRATLAYRRALELDPDLARAERNLAWVRERGPSWLPRPRDRGALESLLFWNRFLSVPARHVVAALAFAAALMLLAPWGRGRRVLVPVAIVPALIWLLMLASIVYQRDASRDAVVLTDGLRLRAADSVGAPMALPDPLPAGAEVVVEETRGVWARVVLADGSAGWLASNGLGRVYEAD
ncbi:MAG: hypothetical protein Tsb0020_23230 [Haliangiales bacterium]